MGAVLSVAASRSIGNRRWQKSQRGCLTKYACTHESQRKAERSARRRRRPRWQVEHSGRQGSWPLSWRFLLVLLRAFFVCIYTQSSFCTKGAQDHYAWLRNGGRDLVLRGQQAPAVVKCCAKRHWAFSRRCSPELSMITA